MADRAAALKGLICASALLKFRSRETTIVTDAVYKNSFLTILDQPYVLVGVLLRT